MFEAVHRTGLVRAAHGLWADRLTVLNYHRIADPGQDGFDTFLPNVSASPETFARQMQHVARWFDVVSLADVVAWLDGERELPAHAALITFDDGYADNFTAAYPILREHGFPAVIFLTSGHIGNDVPFYWDLLAHCLHHTRSDRVESPDGVELRWTHPAGRRAIERRLVGQLKALPHGEREAWLACLPGRLGVTVAPGTFRKLFLTWDEVREMQRGGIEFGGHSVSHPILTRIPLDEARREIAGSKQRIEAELGRQILGFAYPNGLAGDFSPQIEQLTAAAGYRAAFTLVHGPSRRREVQERPFAVRRNFVSHKHTFAEFAAVASGFNRYRP